MRLHAIILALCVLGAHTASIPDKKDIEKKLAAVVKEVLNKDEVPIDNVSSAQELIEQTDEVKDVENNLRKSAQPSDILVKVVVENVQPSLKTEDKKEDNEVSPANEDSSEIIREEIDLKNPGPPQRMQHDTQHPETFVDTLQTAVLRNSEWRESQQYALFQKEMKELKENFENKMNELYGSLQEHWNTHPAQADDGQKEVDNFKVRSSVRDDASSSSSSSSSNSSSSSGSTENPTNQWGGGPFGGFFQNWASSFQSTLQNMNQTVNSYWNNNTNSNNSSQCSGSGSVPNVFNWGNNNPLNFGQQQGTSQQQQSDEPARPGLWQSVQNFFANGGQQLPPVAQSDTPQPPQPNRPVIQALQNLGSFLRPPGQSEPQQPTPVTTNQEGSNVVPTETKPETQKKPAQVQEATPQQSGPIKQMIDNNPVVQSLAGAVQRLQHSITPTKPREDVKAAGDTEAQATKGGLFYGAPAHPSGTGSGDNNDINSSRVDVLEVEETPEVTQEVQETPAENPTKEESPVVQDKTE